MGKIHRLDFSGNLIQKIENLYALTGLQILNLSCNRIKRIENLQPVSKTLVELDLSGNLIQRIPVSIGHLVKLRVLNISNNSLDTVSRKLNSIGDIEHLYLAW